MSYWRLIPTNLLGISTLGHTGGNSITKPIVGEHTNSLLINSTRGLPGKITTRRSAGILNWGTLQAQACWGEAILRSVGERRYCPQVSLQGK
jgi:hypothetical protein